MRSTIGLFATLSLLASGCTTERPTKWKLPADLGQDCTEHCSTLGMRLSAVVIVLNASGCVCEPKGTERATPGGPAGAASGAVVGYVLAQRQREDSSKTTAAGRPSGVR